MYEPMEKWFVESLFHKMLECESDIEKRFQHPKFMPEKQTLKFPKNSRGCSQKSIRKQTKTLKNKSINTSAKDHTTVTIDAEFQKFKLENERHQQEIKRERAEQSEYVMDTDSPLHKCKPTFSPPSQHPIDTKNEEMKRKYGSKFHTISMLELKLQAKFDTEYDVSPAPFWPVISLKL